MCLSRARRRWGGGDTESRYASPDGVRPAPPLYVSAYWSLSMGPCWNHSLPDCLAIELKPGRAAWGASEGERGATGNEMMT